MMKHLSVLSPYFCGWTRFIGAGYYACAELGME